MFVLKNFSATANLGKTGLHIFTYHTTDELNTVIADNYFYPVMPDLAVNNWILVNLSDTYVVLRVTERTPHTVKTEILARNNVVQISVEGTSDVGEFRVPDPTATELTAIYNAVVAGNNVQIVDPYDVYYQVLQADATSDTKSIVISYFGKMFLVYTLENDSVSITAIQKQDQITGTSGNILYINPNGKVSDTKLDTNATKLNDPDTESLSGLAESQKDVNEEFVEALTNMANGLGTGYDRTKQQLLTNVNGTMKWVDKE